MMKNLPACTALICLLSLPSPTVWAQLEKSPYDTFSTDKMDATSVNIKWRPVANVQKECEAESHRRGNGGFNMALEACAFWQQGVMGRECLIITPKKPNYWNVGHEVRHCFQGSFH
jgi:hypothetical protein